MEEEYFWDENTETLGNDKKNKGKEATTKRFRLRQQQVLHLSVLD